MKDMAVFLWFREDTVGQSAEPFSYIRKRHKISGLWHVFLKMGFVY